MPSRKPSAVNTEHGAVWTTLARDATTRLARRWPVTIVRVEHGTVLVTRKDDLEDHVLEPGDELFLDEGDLAVAWAFTDARLSLREAAPSGSTLQRSGLVGRWRMRTARRAA